MVLCGSFVNGFWRRDMKNDYTTCSREAARTFFFSLRSNMKEGRA